MMDGLLKKKKFIKCLYLQQQKQKIPEGFEINANGKFGKITLVGGEEVVWGYKNNFLLKYNFKILGFENTFIHKYEKYHFIMIMC
jgi:hypothetical protein